VEKSKPDIAEKKGLTAETANSSEEVSQPSHSNEGATVGNDQIRYEPQSVTTLHERPAAKKNGKDSTPRKPIVEVLHDIYDRNVQ
jgi:hypothetical protein